MGKVLIDRSNGNFFAIYAENPVGETMDVPDFVFENPSEWMLVEGKIVPCPDYIDFVDGLKNAAMQRVENWELTERAAGIEHAGHRWLTSSAALQDIRDVLLAGVVPGEQWVTADRQIVPMTLPELQSLWQAITARGAAIYQHRLEMEQQIAGMDREQLEAFRPGWPPEPSTTA